MTISARQEQRNGRQFLVLLIDYFVGLVVHTLVSTTSLLFLDIDFSNIAWVSFLGTASIAYLLPAIVFRGATFGVLAMKGVVTHRGAELGIFRMVLRSLLYIPVMMVALYVLCFNGLFGKSIPFDPFFNVRIMHR